MIDLRAIEHVTRVRVREIRPGRWSATDIDTGETLISSARDPEHEACRVLLGKGATGIIETYTGDSAAPSFRMPIAAGAALTVTEPDRGRARIVKWVPFSRDMLETQP